MILNKDLRAFTALLGALLILPAPPLQARTRKGDKAYKLAQRAEDRQEWDKALELYEQAIHEDPSDASYQLGLRRTRFQAGQKHVEAGLKLREQGQLEQALVEFQKAFTTDPSSAIALQEMKRTSEALDRNKGGGVKPEDKPLTPAERARKESVEKIASLQPVPELKPITHTINSLRMNNQPPKVLYETVGKLAGINVVVDPQYQSSGKNANVDLANVTLEEALDYIGVVTHTFWTPVTPNTILVADDNVARRRDLESQVVKVFYLQNMTSTQEFQEVVNSVRSITDIRRMFTFNAQNAVMVRGTVDQVALAEKLFHDLDKAKAEVVVDVIVMEANTARTRDLAAGLTAGGKTGLVAPIQFSPRNPILSGSPVTTTGTTTTTTGTTTGTTGTNVNAVLTNPYLNPYANPYASGLGGLGGLTGLSGTTQTQSSAISLARIGHISTNDFSVSLPGALLQAVMSDRSTRVLQSPQVRASDGQKVSLRIGDKIPYATGSLGPGVGGGIGIPYASTQFQFAEVGVNVDLTPHVHGSDELTLHIEIEISNVRDHVDIGGISQPVIGQRKNTTDIRVRDGEVNLLGGLMQSQDSKTISGIPGLVNVPILGKVLFGSDSREKDRGELLIALVPHVVRTPNLTDVDMRGVAAGTDQVVKVNYAPRRDAAPEPSGTAAPPSAAPAPAAPVQPAGQPAATPAPSPAVTGPARVFFVPATVGAQLSGPVAVSLQAENVSDLFAAPVTVKWDPRILRLNQVSPGALLSQDGQRVAAPIDIRNDAGEASVSLTRLPGAGGVTGSGVLAGFTFMAVGRGTGTITVTQMGLKNSKQEPINVPAPSLPVTIQ